MQGFKSFADPVNIELNDGVTCIIGPNGSGKSNISDALRWVLGEQSSRQLRGAKMQDVIFAGTATRKPKGMAEVTLVIDNSAGILPLEYNEVAVTRRMYRSGESEYLINGNQCRLRDIRELFMDTGIGVEGYSIIGQGKIADIVSTKPENRRQIFEEAAGVVLYKTRKTEAENKLKAATVDLDRVRDIIAEIEGRIDGLKEDSEKATEYLELRDRYKKLGINIILHNLEKLEGDVKSGKEELETLKKTIEETSNGLSETDEKLEQARLEEAELNEKYADANQKLLTTIDELGVITSGGRINHERLLNIEKELERINEDLKTAAEKLVEEKEELARLEEGEKSVNAEMEQVKKELDDAVLLFNDHTGRNSALNIEIEKLKDQMMSLSNKNVERNAEINTLSSYKTTLEERKVSLSDDYEGRDRTEADNRARLIDLMENLKTKEDELESSKARLDEVSNNILSATETIEKISAEIDELSHKLSKAAARRSTIEEMEANYEGYNNTVRMLMQRNQSGIIGTVSDIIEVPSEYVTAVETALGGALQHIVCEDDNSAKSAINWLKSSKSGRATFLPVASVRADRLGLDSSVKSAKGFIGIASEMVDTKNKYREIVDYLLCRVIIADNMDDAISISKKNVGGYRIVTLEGEVINAFGAITGGKFSNKTANLLDRKQEIGTLKAQIDDYDKKTKELISQKESEEKTRGSLRDERTELRTKISSAEIEYNVLKSDIEHAESMVKADEGAAERYKSEIETIDSDLERADKLIDKYKAEIDAAEKEIAEIEQSADKLMAEAETMAPLIEEDNEKIVALKIKIGENETRVLSGNEIIERVRDSITDLETSIEENTTEQEDLTRQKELLTNTGAESGDKENSLREAKEALEAEIESLAASLDANKTNSDMLMHEQKESRNKLENIKEESYRLEVKTARNETLSETQKEKLWDEFEVSYAEALDMRDDDFGITAGNRESREIRLRLAELGDVNVGSIEEYKAVSKRYEFMTTQEADITKAMDELNEIIRNMDKTIKTKFKENFDKVVVNFEESFKELFGGGYAELRLEDETKPLESGIEITAQPPGKKLKNINLLSGGEKTLTAIALMFAVLKAKPTPFVILDEVEAALDEVNIERFSDYLKNFGNIQFALITHQKATMEHADVLYGVTMPEQGISRMLSLKLGDEFDMEGLE